MPTSRNVIFDAGMLILLLQDNVAVPVHPETKQPITRPKDRVAYLYERLNDEKSKILIPAPAFSEFLVGAGAALEKYVDDISNESCFLVVAFSEMAAIEAAVATYHAKQRRKKIDDIEKAAWQRVKIDVQILAIAKVSKAEMVYTTDQGVVTQAGLMGMPATHLADLDLPPDDSQKEIEFPDDHEEDEPEPQPDEVQRSGDGPTEGPAATEEQAEAGEGDSEKEAPKS